MEDPTIEHRSNGSLVATYYPAERGDSIYAHLGSQTRPCVFELGAELRDSLFPEGVAGAELFNISEEHEGLGDSLTGWAFRVRFWID